MLIFLIAVLVLISLLASMGAAGGVIGVLLVVVMIGIGVSIHSQNKENKSARYSHHTDILNGKNPNFSPTKNIYKENMDYAIYVDEANRKIMIAQLLSNVRKIYNFEDIIECSILEDNSTAISSSAGKAFVGGVLAGTAGAVVGASTKKSKPTILALSVRIITKDIGQPLYDIPIITSEIERTTQAYRESFQFAQEIYATIISAMNASKSGV